MTRPPLLLPSRAVSRSTRRTSLSPAISSAGVNGLKFESFVSYVLIHRPIHWHSENRGFSPPPLPGRTGKCTADASFDLNFPRFSLRTVSLNEWSTGHQSISDIAYEHEFVI